MGSQRESERVTEREGEMAGCTVYKRTKEDRKEGEGKRQGLASQTTGAGRNRAEEKVRQREVQQTSE